MNKPIDKLSFWKERIESAQQEHFSVYVVNPLQWRRIEARHIRVLREKTSGRVLDAGCGYGRMAPYVSDYTGVDFSPDFIKKAKSKYPDKTFIQANLKDLPFKDKEFDWAFSISMKRMVEDNLGEEEWKKMQNEVLRVAKNYLILEYEDYESMEIL